MRVPVTIKQYNEIMCEEINKLKKCYIEITEIQNIVKGDKLKNTQEFLLEELKSKIIKYARSEVFE